MPSLLAAALILAPAVASAFPASVRSADAAERGELLHANLRSGWRMQGGSHMAALQLTLKPEWKTYWRAPGDAGIPPQFDWSGSVNVKSVTFHWPSPKLFHSNGMRTVGYSGDVVLPIEVVPQDPRKPVHLQARVDLGVCKDICVPTSVTLAAELPNGGREDVAIRAALGSMPSTAKRAGMQRISCSITPIRDGLRITAQIELPPQGREEMVVFEPKLAGVWVSEAEITRQGKVLVAQADMVPPSSQPFSLDRSNLLVTVIGDSGHAVEIRGCPAPRAGR